MVVTDRVFRRRNVAVLRDAQEALNIAFGAILSAYIGSALTVVDDGPFDHWRLARFFIMVAGFIGGLCVGNAMLLRGNYGLAALFMIVGLICAVGAHHDGHLLGFEVVILRILAACWAFALLASDAILTVVIYLHHRNGP